MVFGDLRHALAIACVLGVAGGGFPAAGAEPVAGKPSATMAVNVVNPRLLEAGDLRAVRTPLGIPNDYKPWIARLKNGQLLIVAFCYGGTPYREQAVFWHSDDGGLTWGPRQQRNDIPGREFSLNCLADGTLLMPCYLLSNDASNQDKHVYSMVYRSTDNGKTWSATRLGPEGFPPKAETGPDWTVIEMPDPKAPGKTTTLLGVSISSGGKANPAHVYLWRSQDSGRTWDKSLKVDTQGWIDVDGFFSQSATYRTASGKWLHVNRVDATGPHWRLPGAEAPKKRAGDNDDRMMLWESSDNGQTWKKHNIHGNFGTYGEMYPRFLKLKDGRVLLTFTVRSSSTDGYGLGLRAVLSDDDGETWDFTHDRLVISSTNKGPSGGGFGNTVQLDDGTLVSCYSYRGTDDKAHVEAVRWSLPRTAIPDNKKLGSILNNDVNNILWALSGAKTTPTEYRKAVLHLLDTRPGVLAQNVGLPDPVIYRTKVATTWDKYLLQVLKAAWPEEAKSDTQAACMKALLDAGTDPLTITIAACRERGVPIVASYRMNAEDFGAGELDMSDFDRQHKDLRIPGANCLDPARPEVFKHRMKIFTEVANDYDIDGIEFDFRRWIHMVSRPHENHPVLTRMVRETRKMLDEVARRKGRKRLLLGVRVGPTIAGKSMGPNDMSCKDLGLDVKTWIDEGLVDYVCPTLFWPRLPGLPRTGEFVELVRGTRVGIYPTVWPFPEWMEKGPDKGPVGVEDARKLRRLRDDICKAALQAYADGADGISTFNWVPHQQPGMTRRNIREEWGLGAAKVQMHIHPLLRDRAALETYLRSDLVLPTDQPKR